MTSEVDLSKKKKKSAGPWTIGWGWFITIPVLYWFAKACKRVMSDKEETISPLAIIKMRYAKGEIDRKEYEEKLKDLSFNSMAP
ncbi:SHOCT domain-containing protein [Thermophagus xiamenensis]|jgi:putative membrane protein|uniref:Short C-terminal domain-containing protein n=1 Tax=Thermophagus xiamenensis TaxID=385682 RepID=A0A1I1ZA55_9BACT|nr:SHOCT domain-containing protein [Thermophagus xiamenensis]SFE28734.1 Short C-terminal domain-containing protein [Thermophagus xiamenensis]